MTVEPSMAFSEVTGVKQVTVNGLAAVSVDTANASGLVFLQGAHVAAFRPAGHAPLIWMSERAVYAPGKALRGGVPVCFPWFGANAVHPDYPAHGFARTLDFGYDGARRTADGAVELEFSLRSDEQTKKLFPHAFTARLRASFAVKLTLEFAVSNDGTEAFDFEAALHSYFEVSDVRHVAVRGLQGASYADKTRGMARFDEDARELRFTSETDRVYDSDAPCIISDPGLAREIRIEKQHSGATVVWNPWAEKAAQMADFGADAWPRMLCVETANVGERRIHLAPNESHGLRVAMSVEKMSTSGAPAGESPRR